MTAIALPAVSRDTNRYRHTLAGFIRASREVLERHGFLRVPVGKGFSGGDLERMNFTLRGLTLYKKTTWTANWDGDRRDSIILRPRS